MSQDPSVGSDGAAFGSTSTTTNGADDGAGAEDRAAEARLFSVVQSLTSPVLFVDPPRTTLKESAKVGKSLSSKSLSCCDGRSSHFAFGLGAPLGSGGTGVLAPLYLGRGSGGVGGRSELSLGRQPVDSATPSPLDSNDVPDAA